MASWRSASRPIRILSRSVRTQARYDYTPRDDPNNALHNIRSSASIATPRELVSYLDQYVIGQHKAKKVLSVAVYNHYNRVRENIWNMEQEDDSNYDWDERDRHRERERPQDDSVVEPARIRPRARPSAPNPPVNQFPTPPLEKSNVLILGPTGSGKTLLARTLARVLDVPFSENDATSFTQAGYVGEDVESCIQHLVQAANGDVFQASQGIVYIDEVDKLARKSASSGTEGSRDVGGEGVQQALLRMIEGSTVTVPAKGVSVDGPGVASSDGRSRSRNPPVAPPRPEVYHINTSNILFILSGSFVGLESIIKRRVAKGSIGFTADLPSPSKDETPGFLPFFTPNRTQAPNLLELVEPTDLVKFGFIPEFVSRVPSITTLSPLTPTDLRRILTDVRGCLVDQFTRLFERSGVEIRFTSRALDEICLKAAERGGGARSLRGVMEAVLLDANFEVPGTSTRYVLIDEGVVRGEHPAWYWRVYEQKLFETAWERAEVDASATPRLEL
ncbi:ClpX ATPase regulatory subunit [Stereum hirsutum FP-91666 SS1]|uniref:ClpX ATPase regulatory subunit n=1 Tax=Stereum hirsutum (strain FP-91666) TaxID=721885 RepID=UPI000440E339|nr:ClpX ATPase regulatory subunit [Stereum hirsutum FP-91666 SS1]EIM88479.1 ClpX ATPase regulatory subunit [Stereum hirsutum FP-91666 SS1]